MADIQRGTPLFDAYEQFILDCTARRLTRQTRQFYSVKLGVLLRWCAAHSVTDPSHITPHHMRAMLVELAGRGLSDAYQHNIARAARAFLNFCVREELISASPFLRVQMPKQTRHDPVSFTGPEIRAVVAACGNDRDKAIVYTLLDSGVRASELCELNVGDVDMATGAVTVRAGKGQKDRTTFVGARTRRQLHRYLRRRRPLPDHAPLFISLKRRQRLTQSGIVQLMQRLAAASGVARCEAHTFRRTFALSCLRNGMNVYALARLMGHADITVLRAYLTLVSEDLQRAHELHGVVDNL